MNRLPAFVGLAVLVSACSSSPSASVLTPDQERVTAYLKKTLDDPASYQPVRWGTPEAISRRDSAYLFALPLVNSSDEDERDQGLALGKRFEKDGGLIIGTSLIHSFRAKNKLGALVLDSARFVVAKTGAVSAAK